MFFDSGLLLLLNLPVWMPIRNFNVSFGLWGIVWFLTAFSKSKAIEAISPACLSPFLNGKPDTYKKCI